MILGISLGLLSLFITFLLWIWCRVASRTPSENVKEQAKSDLREKQKLCSHSSDIIFTELSSNSSSSESWVIPLEVLPDGKKSSSIEGNEDTGRVTDGQYDQYDTSDWTEQSIASCTLLDNYSQGEQSSSSALSYIDHIRAPANVFNFYAKLENKHGPSENSFSAEYDYMNRGTRKSMQLRGKSETIEDGGVRSLLKSDVKENRNYSSVRNLQNLDDGYLSVKRSYTPPSSCSLISLDDGCISNSRELLRFEGYLSQHEEIRTLETSRELSCSKKWGPKRRIYRRPESEQSEFSCHIRSSETRRASWSSIDHTDALSETFEESHGDIQDHQSVKESEESKDTRFLSTNTVVTKNVLDSSKDISYDQNNTKTLGRMLETSQSTPILTANDSILKTLLGLFWNRTIDRRSKFSLL